MHTSFDGSYTETTSLTTSSFEDFLAAIGEEAPEVLEAPKEEVIEDEEVEETDEMDFEKMLEDQNKEEGTDEEDTGDDAEEEASEDDSDEADESTEEETEEEEVDFGELEIDMDSEIQVGEDFITVNDLIKNRIAADEIKAQREEIETLTKEVEERDSTVKLVLEKARLECEKVIEDYEGFEWKKMAAEDPKQYAEHKEFLEAYLERKEELDKDFAELKDKEAKAEEARKASVAEACVKELKADIPTWNDELYQGVMNYAINTLGMKEEFVTASTDAGFFKTVLNVMKRESDLKTAVTKVRQKTVKKVAKSKPAKAAVKKAAPKGISSSDVGISSHDAAAFDEFSKLGLFD